MKETDTIEQKLLRAFDLEFSFLKDKFEIMNLLGNNSPMDYETI